MKKVASIVGYKTKNRNPDAKPIYRCFATINKPLFSEAQGLSVLEKSCYSSLTAKKEPNKRTLERACVLEKV